MIIRQAQRQYIQFQTFVTMQEIVLTEENVIQYKGYTFIYENPQDLIGLSKIQKIIPLMFNVAKNNIIWVTTKIDEQLFQKIISHMPIKTFKTISEVQGYLSKKPEQKRQKNIIILESYVNLIELRFFERDDIVAIIFYKCEFQAYQQNTGFQKLCCFVQSQEQLLEEISYYKLGQLESKHLPNFVQGERDGKACSIVISAMQGMLHMKDNSKVRGKIIVRLKNLVKQICQQNKLYQNYHEKMQKFIEQLTNFLTPQKAIYWYTTESPVYRIVNNLLRSSRHPFEIYYIQPYFKDLFNAVNRLYFLQKNSYSNIVLFRGGMASNQEIQFYFQNIGKYVENLSFLSTSLRYEVASNHIVNILFEIFVPDFSKNQAGFAHIKKNSAYFVEEEVLFNPMNSFKIMDAKKVKKFNRQIIHVNLKFEEKDGTVRFKQQSFEYQVQRKFKWFQGGCLISKDFSNSFFLEGAYEIWQVFIKISKNNIFFQNYGVLILAQIEKNVSNYQKAIEYYKYLQQVLKNVTLVQNDKFMSQKKINLYLLKLYALLAQAYLEIKCFGLMNQYLQRIKNNEFKNEINQKTMIIILRLNIIHQQVNHQFDKVKEYLKKCNEIVLSKYGENNIQYAYNLIYQANFLAIILKNYLKSQKLFCQAEKIIIKLTGQQSLEYSTILYNRSTLCLYQNRYGKAVQLYERSWKKMQKYPWGIKKYHLISEMLSRIAFAYLLSGNITKSIDVLKDNRKICFKIMNHTNQKYYENVLKILFVCYISKGLFCEALECLEECRRIDLCESKQALFLFSIENYQAKIYQNLKMFKLALEHYMKAEKILENKFGKDKKDINKIQRNKKEVLRQKKVRFSKIRKVNSMSFRQF